MKPFHTIGLLLLLAAIAVHAEEYPERTAQIASPGQPVPARTNWPAGVMELVNHPLRTEGWCWYFADFNYANDETYYALRATNSADVNRLIKLLAAVRAPVVRLLLSPAADGHSAGLGIAAPAVFSIGDQKMVDDWFAGLQPDATGYRRFGDRGFKVAPVARPPTLTLFVGSDLIDLNALEIPTNVETARDVNYAYHPDPREEAADKAITAFFAKRSLQSPDPIARLAATLTENPRWRNGGFPSLGLPKTATTEDVLTASATQSILPAGPLASPRLVIVKSHHVLETRSVELPGPAEGPYQAVLAETDQGLKIALLQYHENVGWWTHWYNVEQ